MLAGGCVERTVTITSEPDNALVYLNDEEIGRTPVTVSFTFYGVYDVRYGALSRFNPLMDQAKGQSAVVGGAGPGPDRGDKSAQSRTFGLAFRDAACDASGCGGADRPGDANAGDGGWTGDTAGDQAGDREGQAAS